MAVNDDFHLCRMVDAQRVDLATLQTKPTKVAGRPVFLVTAKRLSDGFRIIYAFLFPIADWTEQEVRERCDGRRARELDRDPSGRRRDPAAFGDFVPAGTFDPSGGGEPPRPDPERPAPPSIGGGGGGADVPAPPVAG